MFWKLSILVFTLGGTACGLLVLRQQELDVLAARTDLHRQIDRQEKELKMLRWEINRLSQDDLVEAWIQEQGLELEPIILRKPMASARPRIHSERVTEEPGG
jgi:cell division protein FtsL